MKEVDDRAPVIVISDRVWSRAFERRADVVGAAMTLDGTTMTIIGVMPPTFRYGPAGGGFAEAWIGLDGRSDPGVPGSGIASPIFRLRTGLSLEAALPMAQAIAQRIQQVQPDRVPWTPVLSPLASNRLATRGVLQKPLTLLLAATGLVLLVACANIANLLSARSIARRHELAMRAALGATRGRLARLLLVEGAAIAFAGGTIAVLLAAGTLKALIALMPSRMLMRSGLFSVSLPEIDWRVLAFTLGVTALVTILSALWPAVRGSKVGQLSTLAESHRVAGMAVERRRMSAVLQTIQVALALVLATGAGLFAASFTRILGADLGFDPNGLLSVSAQLPGAKFKSPESQRLAFEQALQRLRAIPGVQSVALGNPPPATGGGRFVRHGSKEVSGSLAIRYASPGYFDTAGIRLIAGREFRASDTPSTTPVAIIDEVGARTLFGGESPLGQRFSYSPYVPELTIVGVVNPVAGASFPTGSGAAGMYLAQGQRSSTSDTFVLRATGGEAGVLAAVQEAFVSIDRDIKVTSFGPVTDYYDQMGTYAAPRFYLSLISLFAVMALVTAAVGLYGLLAFSVGQRQREIGVRVALGATAGGIRSLVIAEAVRPVMAGLVAGWAVAWMATGVLRSFLYQVSPHDFVTFTGSAAVLLVVALLATIGPIRRATGVDPIHALRAE
jgi:predicted permease